MAKQVMVKVRDNMEGKIVMRKVKADIEAKGWELTTDRDKAELYINQSTPKGLSFHTKEDQDVIRVVFDKGQVKYYLPEGVKLGRRFNVMEADQTKVNCVVTPEQDKEAILNLVRFVIEGTTVEVPSILGGTAMWKLAILMSKGYSKLDDNEKAELLEIGIGNEAVAEVMAEEIRKQISFKESKVGPYMRLVEYFHLGDVAFPNIGDNIFKNIIEVARAKKIISTMDVDTANDKQLAYWRRLNEEIDEKRNSMRVTYKESVLGSKAFARFKKKGKGNDGVYSLFIPDNSLKNGEVLIPHYKTVPGSDKDNYPKIGDRVGVIRHPITGILMEVTVVGFTMDGSIKINGLTALAFYGDADGDAISIFWGHFVDNLELHTTDDMKGFCNSANIKVVKHTVKKKQFSLKSFTKNDTTDTEGLNKTGKEQAEAKKITSSQTGFWGSIERQICSTAIITDEQLTMEDLYHKSLLSQLPVQAKNVLDALRNAKDFSAIREDHLIAIELFTRGKGGAAFAKKGIKEMFATTEERAFELAAHSLGQDFTKNFFAKEETKSKDKINTFIQGW